MPGRSRLALKSGLWRCILKTDKPILRLLRLPSGGLRADGGQRSVFERLRRLDDYTSRPTDRSAIWRCCRATRRAPKPAC
ncbi:MAG: hypothetical protein U0521_09440 [Anaerolineae bacterium]